MWIVLFVACLISTGVHADDNARAPTISSEGATLRLYVYCILLLTRTRLICVFVVAFTYSIVSLSPPRHANAGPAFHNDPAIPLGTATRLNSGAAKLCGTTL